MRIVDSHCHAALPWYEPVESLLHQMDRCGVEWAVLIQIRGLTDNDYQFACVRRYPDRLVSVVAVDTTRPDAPDELERLAERGAHGVRLWTTSRSPGNDPLRIWRKAAELKLPISVNGTPETFASPEFAAIVEATAGVPLIIEHLGGGNTPDTDQPRHPEGTLPRRQAVFALARHRHVMMKIHGLGEFATRRMPVTDPFPFVEPIPPLLELAYEAFGPERLMWGSDFPPVSGREGYGNALALTLARFSGKSDTERAAIFGANAARVFGIPPA